MSRRDVEASALAAVAPGVLDLVSDCIVLLDAEDRFLYLNGRAIELLGLDAAGASSLLGRTVLEAFPEALSSTFVHAANEARITGQAMVIREYYPPLESWMETRVHGLPDRSVVVLFQPYRELGRSESETEAQLGKSEERFRTLVELSSEVSALFDHDGRLLYASPAYRRLVGYSPAAAVTIDHATLVHPDDLPSVLRAVRAAGDEPGALVEATFRIRRGDGEWRTFAAIGRDMRHDTSLRGFLVNARDITAQRHLEEQLRQSQKMEALGQLAGGVAHDFNNILAAISGFAELLRAELDPGDPRQEYAGEILRAGGRAARVTRQLLAFSRRQALSIEVLDIRTVVDDIGRMLRPLLPASITLLLPGPGLPLYVRADKVQLEQVLMNLAVNARDAMPDGGTLTVDVQRTETDDGTWAVLDVRDTGTGMTEHTLQHLFEPFFTTKVAGRGTGLGLPTVYGIVRQLGGSVKVWSEPGRGSTFTIALAATDDRPDIEPRRRELPMPHSARQLVLVVEDEEQVRRLVVRLLERSNYEVRVASNGMEALALLEAGLQPALVLSDSAMPVMGGRELASRLAQLRPNLPVVLMSGLLEAAAGDDAEAMRAEWVQHAAGFVEKPFTAEQLLAAIRRALPD